MIVRIIILVLVNFLLLAEVGETSDMIPDTTTFSELVETKLYVDKTGLLIDFISGAVKKAVYAAVPRRFGKTMNNQMIKDFFHVSFEEDGYTLIKDKTKDPRYQRFKTMTNLEVVQNEKFFDEHFGNYIVVYLTLSRYSQCKSEQQLIRKLVHSIISNGFSPFREWWDRSGCKGTICDKGDLICCSYLTDIFVGKYDDMEWDKAFSCLFNSLREYYQKEVILIVDEFDKSIIDSLRYLNYDTAETILRFLGNTFGGLSKIPEAQDAWCQYPVFRALFTGITHLPGYAQMSNVQIYPYFKKNPLSRYYGFNQTEVDILLQRYNLQDKKEDLKDFYDGYKIMGADWQSYNPVSVVQFFQSKGKIKSYWRKTGSVFRCFQFCHDAKVFHNIELLALGYNVSLYIRLTEGVKYLDTMKEVLYICESPENELRPQINIEQKHREYFFKYLLQEGYLSPADSFGKYNLFAAPNAEIRQQFSEFYTEYARQIMKINLTSVANVFWTMADTCSIDEKFVKILSENFHRLVQNRIQKEDDYNYNEQALRSMVYFSCEYKLVSSSVFGFIGNFVSAQVRVESVAFIDIKWSDTQTIRYGLDDKKYGKADVYLKLNHGETIVMIGFKMDTNFEAAAKQVLSYRPPLEDQGKCKKLVLVWVVIPRPGTLQKDGKTPLQMKPEDKIQVSVGCYVIENYDAKNSVARICADPESPFQPGTVPKDFFLKPIPV